MEGLFRGARVKVKIGKALVDGTVVDVRVGTAMVAIDRPSLTMKVDIDAIGLVEKPPRPPEIAPPRVRPRAVEKNDIIEKRKSLESLEVRPGARPTRSRR